MAGDVARAVGAGSSVTVNIAGKDCVVRPLTIKELGEVEAECLSLYKQSVIKTYQENIDTLVTAGMSRPDAMALLERKLEQVSGWDVSDLPHKTAYSVNGIPITPKLRALMASRGEFNDSEFTDKQVRKILASLLDSGVITEIECRDASGVSPSKVKIGYANWWVTATMDGMCSMVWSCFKHSGVTRDDVIAHFSKSPAAMMDMAREVENATAPSTGNG